MLIDSHAHLDDNRFNHDLPKLLDRAKEAGVESIITVGTGIDSCNNALKLAETYPDILYVAAGIDPHSADKAEENDLAQLTELAANPHIVAVGETGLEYFFSCF